GRDEPAGPAAPPPEGRAGARGFRDRRDAGAAAGPGRGAGPRPLPLARPVHARAHVGREELLRPGRARRGDGGADGGRGRRLERPGLRGGRHRARRLRLAALLRRAAGAAVQDRPEGGAALGQPRRARHAGADRLGRARGYRPAEIGRDRRRLRRLGRGRPGGGADRQDPRLQGGRHRRRGEEVRVRHRGAGIRRLHRPSRRPRRAARPALPAGDRRLLGECRRRGAARGLPAHERSRPHGDVRHDRRVQRHRGTAGAEPDGDGAQAPPHPGIHRQRHRLAALPAIPPGDAGPYGRWPDGLARGCGGGAAQCADGLHRPAEGEQFRQARRQDRL
ncbi:MAG: Putative oxidoreductase YncB, partial [uncultured Craurococcus sp.]